METIRTHKATANLFLDIEMAGVQLNFLTGGNRTHERADAARRQTIEALFEHLLVADCFERIVDAAIAERLDFLDWINPGRVHRMSRAEVPGGFEFAVEQIDRDYLAGASDSGPLDDRGADAAGAEHRHRRTGTYFRRVQCGADAGSHRTSEQRGTVERYIVSNL